MEEEIWKPIKGYEGFYEISNLGRVKSLDRWYYSNKGRHVHVKEKIMSLCDDSKGYPFVVLSKHNKMKMMPIHRLIAEAFIPNPLNYPCIDHIDCNKENNHVDNLKWCTQSQNRLNPITRKRSSAAKKGKRSKWTCRSVVCLKNGTLVKTYDAIRDAYKDGHIEQCISRVCRGLRETYHGLQWMYLSDYENLVNQ